MSNYSLQINSIKKNFGRRLIFNDLNFTLEGNSIFGISGSNGSGKSTLVKIIAGILSPSSGSVIHINNGSEIPLEKLHDFIGFVSPYLVLYDEFSSTENLEHFAKIRGQELDKEKTNYLFNEFNIYDRKDDLLKTYSSGMKQRLKFIFALSHSPDLVILDEPTSNLDAEGKETVYKIIKEEAKKNIVIIASNEESDLILCGEKIQLENFKNIPVNN